MGQKAVVKLLLERGAQIGSRDTSYPLTPLSLAAEKGHEAVVKLLREREAQIKSNRGFRALLSSAKTKMGS
jgi:ankyrin repeat protein